MEAWKLVGHPAACAAAGDTAADSACKANLEQ